MDIHVPKIPPATPIEAPTIAPMRHSTISSSTCRPPPLHHVHGRLIHYDAWETTWARFECGGGTRRCGQWNHLGGGGGGTTHAATDAEVKERRT